MSANQRHVIKRLQIEIIAGEADADRVWGIINRAVNGPLSTAFGQICDNLADPSTRYTIDRLELDLGTIATDTLEGHLVDAFRGALHTALHEHLQTSSTPAHPPATGAIALLAIFAERGHLPWFADAHRPDVISEALYTATREMPDTLREELRRWVQHPSYLQRIIRHASDDALQTMLHLFLTDPDQRATVTTLPKLIVAAERAYSARLRVVAWTAALQRITVPRRSTASDIYYAVLTAIATALQVPLEKLIQRILKHPDSTSAPNSRLRDALSAVRNDLATDATTEAISARNNLMTAFTHLWATLRDADPSDAALRAALIDADIPPNLWPAVLAQLRQHPPPDLPPTARDHWATTLASLIAAPDTSAEPTPAPDANDDTLYVNNAGLVLLWPFLTRFFQRVNLYRDGGWAEPMAQQRAVALVQYIATGQDLLLEYQTMLNKVLCGLPTSTLLVVDTPLTDAERTEADNLLTAVIAQAAVLGDMSLDGLRGSFLLRAGALQPQPDGWLLHVERQSFDVVLSRFPWGWSFVRLPWMPAPVQVVW